MAERWEQTPIGEPLTVAWNARSLDRSRKRARH
jgi:hypothetical protein